MSSAPVAGSPPPLPQPAASAAPRTQALRLALAGGGTGGHLVPGLHLCAALPGAFEDVLWLTAGRGVEERVLAAGRLRGPCAVEALPVERPGGGAPGWGRLALRMPGAVARARAALRAHGSNVLLGLGGHASIPAVVAARSLSIPVALLEINAASGRSTRGLARLASRVLHAWPSTYGGGARERLVGPPLAPEFDPARAPWPDVARERLSFAPERPLLVVLGGSQGAGALNAFVREHQRTLLGSGIGVLHQVGPGRLGEAGAPLAGYRAVEYLDDVPLALAAATLVLGRGGASTVAEIAALGVPAWIVPYPHHADRHQERNARELGAGARIVPESELGHRSARELVLLCSRAGEAERASMRAALRRIVPRDGAERVLEVLRELV